MTGKEININKIEDVRKFVQICSKYESDINVYMDRLIIDGKSLLGMFSLDLSKNINVEILSSNDKDNENFYSEMEQFIPSRN